MSLLSQFYPSGGGDTSLNSVGGGPGTSVGPIARGRYALGEFSDTSSLSFNTGTTPVLFSGVMQHASSSGGHSIGVGGVWNGIYAISGGGWVSVETSKRPGGNVVWLRQWNGSFFLGTGINTINFTFGYVFGTVIYTPYPESNIAMINSMVIGSFPDLTTININSNGMMTNSDWLPEAQEIITTNGIAVTLF